MTHGGENKTKTLLTSAEAQAIHIKAVMRDFSVNPRLGKFSELNDRLSNCIGC
jgi:hypothetical protein